MSQLERSIEFIDSERNDDDDGTIDDEDADDDEAEQF